VSPTRIGGPAERQPALRHRTPRKRTPRAALVGLAAGSTLLLTGCSQDARDQFSRAYLPESATQQGEITTNLWVGSWIAAMIVGILVWGLIGWAVIAYSRRRRPGYPVQTRYNLPIEILWTVLPFIMIGVLFFYTARDQNELLKLTDDPDVTVDVVGFRWSWAFSYLDNGVYDIGVPATNNVDGEPTAEIPTEGYTGPTLYLSQNQTVRFVLTSPDVIHSFYVPSFLFKMDLIPGRTNQFEVTPTKLGTYAGKCAELCGLDHSRMLFNVKVVTQDEYDARMAALKAKGQTGVFDSGRVSTKADQGQGRTLTDTDKGRSTPSAEQGESK
jgi:cytochrome c oxidase subunit 2